MKKQRLNIRSIYEAAYRNARCVHSLDERAVSTPIATTNTPDRLLTYEIVAYAMESARNRNEPMMSWFCITYQNQFNLRKEQLSKVTVTEVVLNRAEGPSRLCGIDHKFPTLAEADSVLMAWAWGMPADQMGYDKVDFTVYLSNGDTYEGRFDLKPSHRISANIKAHMVSHLEWVAKNGDMIGAKYAEQAKVALPVYRSL